MTLPSDGRGQKALSGGKDVCPGALSETRPLNGLYASTKHALEAITETLYYAMRRFDIPVAASIRKDRHGAFEQRALARRRRSALRRAVRVHQGPRRRGPR